MFDDFQDDATKRVKQFAGPNSDFHGETLHLRDMFNEQCVSLRLVNMLGKSTTITNSVSRFTLWTWFGPCSVGYVGPIVFQPIDGANREVWPPFEDESLHGIFGFQTKSENRGTRQQFHPPPVLQACQAQRPVSNLDYQ
jgi:hypothetical protein